ncbi:RNA polymerase sigma factor [Steroidobacter sp.]|uniref:RNA polymerase sigma factor n=1 Tax=Steroidobacter sp. TaxID=1978227 RepID=UPI00260088E6|nr:sigma-70 family RNA polymerase sigma factor [Steroidobacter sp.]
MSPNNRNLPPGPAPEATADRDDGATPDAMGDAGATQRAFETLRAGLHRYLRRRLRHAQDVEDLAQEVYLRLLRFTDPKQVKSPAAYLFQVALHVLYEFRLHQNRGVVTFDSTTATAAAEHLPDPGTRPEEAHEQQLLRERCSVLIEHLPPMQRLVLLLTTREELSNDQIAEKLGISASTVRVHLFRAIANLRDEVSKDRQP